MQPKARSIQIFAIAIVVIILLNLILFSFHKIGNDVFWVVIVACALIAYKGIPWLKNRK